MAIIPATAIDYSEWQVTNIDNDILVIQFPGTDDEIVHFRFLSNHHNVGKFIQEFNISEVMTQDRKNYVLFWVGYFYAKL